MQPISLAVGKLHIKLASQYMAASEYEFGVTNITPGDSELISAIQAVLNGRRDVDW